MTKVCFEWRNGEITDGDIPEGYLGRVLPIFYKDPSLWRVWIIGEDGIPFPSYKEFRERYGGIATPEVDRIEEERNEADIKALSEDIDQIGKRRREFINRLDSLFPH